MRICSLEPTPNPNAFKFNLEEKLCTRPRSFQNREDAASDPLADLLFAVDGVASIFYMDHFVTISKTEESDWESVMTETGQRLIDFDVEKLAAEEAVTEENNAELDEETAELLRKVNLVIDDMIRPALAGDGGGLTVLGIDNNTVYIRYQGACGSCPSSVSGTLNAIQQLLKYQVSPDLTVIPA